MPDAESIPNSDRYLETAGLNNGQLLPGRITIKE